MGSEYFPKFLSGIPFTPVNRSKFIYSNKTIDAKGIIQPLEDFLENQKYHPSISISLVKIHRKIL